MLHLIGHIGLSLVALTCLFPYFWMVSTSFKLKGHVFAFPPEWIPNPATLDAYRRLFTYIPFFRQFLNTVFVCVTIVIGQLIFSSMGAYAFARLRFPGRDVLFLAYLATMMVPGQVTLIPSYVLMRILGWINTYWALIGPPFLGSAFATFFLRQFMMTIPVELEDAARIDGAGYFRIYSTIMLPLIRPALATIAVFAFVYFWNDFLWPLVVINSEEKKVLTVAIATLAQSYYGVDWPVMMAGAVLSVLPLLLIFFSAQRYFVEGIVMSGLKG
ncbi:MAG TPA: carbohydrate ABC transporter permease [Caldilineae bacterium]|nr:carbohydrate ABC transporter permease [Caldilineae bacterium]